MERPLGELRLCAVLIDGTPFKDRQMVVGSALAVTGANGAGRLREGAIENATVVVGALLSDLPARGVDFSTPRGCMSWIVPKHCVRQSAGTLARQPSSSAVKSIRSATSRTTC